MEHSLSLKQRLQNWSQWQYSILITILISSVYVVTLYITSDVVHALNTVIVSAIVLVVFTIVFAVTIESEEVLASLILLFAASLAVFSAVGMAVTVRFVEIIGMFAVLAVLIAILGAYIYGTSRFSAALMILLQIAVTYGLFEISNYLLLG